MLGDLYLKVSSKFCCGISCFLGLCFTFLWYQMIPAPSLRSPFGHSEVKGFRNVDSTACHPGLWGCCMRDSNAHWHSIMRWRWQCHSVMGGWLHLWLKPGFACSGPRGDNSGLSCICRDLLLCRQLCVQFLPKTSSQNCGANCCGLVQ